MKTKLLILALFTSGSLFAQNTFPNPGNVGIGTVSPGNLLQINSGTSPSTSQLKITANGEGGVSILTYAPDNSALNFDSDWSSGWIARSTSAASIYKSAGKLTFYGDAGLTPGVGVPLSPRMTINLANGNVGIGTTSPNTTLDVNGSATINGPGNTLTLRKSTNNIPALAFQGVAGISTVLEGGDDFLTASLGGARRFTILSNGNVGIGTTSPTGKLHIAGAFTNGVIDDGNDRPGIGITGNYPQAILMAGGSNNPNHGSTIMLGAYDSGTSGANKRWSIGTGGKESTFFDIGYSNSPDLNPHSGIRNYNGTTIMTLLNSGNVGIGTTIPDSKLTVKGKIHAEEVKVDLAVPGPDYVFEKSYDLKSLSEVETFIDQNKHLPEIPSAKTMKKEGINVGEMQMNLLKKIEELTLYLIEQKKEITSLRQEVAALKK